MPQHKSPFPDGFLGVDIHYAGSWHDIMPDVDQSGVSIRHGSTAEGFGSEPSQMEFTLRNGDGKYSPRNPRSPLYGQIGRNTPARATLALGAPFLDLTQPDARAEGPTGPATGALDIRWWGYIDDWSGPTATFDLISKGAAFGELGWDFFVRAVDSTGFSYPVLGLRTVTGGDLRQVASDVAVPSWAGEIALRVQVDADEVVFSYAKNLASEWVEMSRVPLDAPADIAVDSAPLRIGPLGFTQDSPQRVYGWHVESSDGVLSSVDLATDTLSGWTLTSAEVTNRRVVAVAEIAEWPVAWSRLGEPSVLSRVTASGVSRRLGQGQQRMESPLRRAFFSLGPQLIAYWPLEDGTDTRLILPEIGEGKGTLAGRPEWGKYTGFAGSDPLPLLSDARVALSPEPYPETSTVNIRWVGEIAPDDIPASGERVLVRIFFTGGTLARYDLALGPAVIRATAVDVDGNSTDYVINYTEIYGPRRFSLEFSQQGDDIEAVFARLSPGATLAWLNRKTFSDLTLGRISQVVFNPGRSNFTGTSIGHVTLENEFISLFDASFKALDGHNGETAADRISRLIAPREVSVTVRGNAAESTQMGVQKKATRADLVETARVADDSLMHDDPTSLAVRLRSHTSLYDQPAVTIPYQENLIIPMAPLDDDATTRNQITVTRDDGASLTIEQTTGPMSSAPAPDGVGLYSDSVTLSLADDLQIERHADWRLHIGTWDEARYPQLGVDLAHPALMSDPVLTRRLLALTPGDRIVITDPPPWLPPTSVDVIVTGIQLQIDPLHVRLTWSCVPARPYRAPYWDTHHRWAAPGTVLAAPITATATTLPIDVPEGIEWTADDGPYDILLAGERMTVTAVDSTSTSMTVIRSVNGVSMPHDVDTPVALAEPSYYGRTDPEP